MHRLFARLRMVVPLPRHMFRSGQHGIPYIPLGVWFRYMLDVRASRLLGGFSLADSNAALCLRSYWSALRVLCPEHVVFQLHGHRLHKCLPYNLHMDEGRGLRKSAVLVASAQSVFGVQTATRFHENLVHSRSTRMDDAFQVRLMLQSQFHNSKCSTWLTRMLLTLLPKGMYTKANQHVFEALLETLRNECTALLETGVQLSCGSVYFPIMVGLKGDSPMIAKAANLTRSFQNLGNPCCWECMAGGPGVPFEDCRADPTYEATLFSERPWSRASPIVEIPMVPGIPEAILLKDPFHIYKQSIGGSFVASTIILLIDLGYFAGRLNNLDAVLERMYQDFGYFVRFEWEGSQVPFIKHFTKTNLHYPRYTAYPYARLKGSDTMLLTRWLRFLVLFGPRDENGSRSGCLIDSPLQAEHRPLMRQIARASNGALTFFSILHNCGLWLSRNKAYEMGQGVLDFCQAYSALAKDCHSMSLNRFSLVPALHMFHHIYVDLKRALQNPNAEFILSSVIGNTEADEDFIGKACRLSRHVHPRSTTARTLDRYVLKLWLVFEEEDG